MHDTGLGRFGNTCVRKIMSTTCMIKSSKKTFSMEISYVERAVFIIRKNRPCLHKNNTDLSKQKNTYVQMIKNKFGQYGGSIFILIYKNIWITSD